MNKSSIFSSITHLKKSSVILASGSPRRKSILNSIGLNFEVFKPDIDEDILKNENPIAYSKRIAELKAEKISKLFSADYIIAADTIVVLNNQIIGKPGNKENAREILHKISDTSHSVITGVACYYLSRILLNFYEETVVTFSKVSESAIDDYLNQNSEFDKAGAYGIQDSFGMAHIERIEGDYLNVVGFPLNKFLFLFSEHL